MGGDWDSVMGATSDHSPRIALILNGPDVHESVRESLSALGGELDARALDNIEVLIGALSRTQTSQLEATDGFELRLWVSPDATSSEMEYEVRDLSLACA
jgi:hypothetical protein